MHKYLLSHHPFPETFFLFERHFDGYWFFEAHYFEDAEHTDHDESILVSMMCVHEVCDVAPEVHDPDEEEKYRHHECTTMITSPRCEYRSIDFEILGLEHSKASNDENEQECEQTGFGNSSDHIRRSFRESFLEHLEGREEYNKESNPLDGWISFQELGNIA